MCEWGTDVEVEDLLTTEGKRRTWKIDSCIASVVRALNEGDVETIASCCGHGKGPGRITLLDGREMFLLPSGSNLMWRRRWNGRTEKRRLVTPWENASDVLEDGS